MFIEAAEQKNTGNTKKAKEIYLELLNEPGQKAPIHYELSLIYHQEGDYENAQTQILKAITLDDSTEWYLNHYIRINKAQRYYSHADAGYEKLLKYKSEDVDFLIEYSDYFITQKRYDDALEVYERIEKLVGVTEHVNKNKYLIYRQKGMSEAALNELKKLNNTFEDKPEFYVDLANHFVEMNQFDSARFTLERGFEILPNHPDLVVGLGDLYFYSEDFPKAQEYYLEVLKDDGYPLSKKQDILEQYVPIAANNKQRQEELMSFVKAIEEGSLKNYELFDFVGRVYYQSGFYEEAQKNFKAAVEDQKKAFSTWELLFQTDYNLQDFESMKTHVDEALSYYPMQARFYYFKGVAENKLGEKQKAIKAFEKADKLNIDDAELKSQVYAALGDLYHETKDYKKSDESFKNALEVDPNNAYTLNNYAYYLSLRNTKLDEALKYSAKSLMMAPSNPSFLDTYGWILYQKGEFELALEKLLLANENAAEPSSEVLEHIGDTYSKLKDLNNALIYYQKALEAGGDPKMLNQKITELK
jgi:tetratricopeptide (TPR) repeat protein